MATGIRTCGPEDLETLREIAIQTYDETFRSMNSPQTMDAYLAAAFSPDRLAREMENPDSEFLFLFHDDRLAGYLKLNDGTAQSDLQDPFSLEVERIYVRREFQGRGLGRVLMEYAIDAAKSRGRRYLWLGVWERNEGAIAFYRKMGFRPFGNHDFIMGSERQRDVLMRLDLL